MQVTTTLHPFQLFTISVLALCLVSIAHGQTPRPTPDETVIRINTELIQTDVTVLDKHGRFVEGLKPEDFELTLNSKSQPILFFERVATGTSQEARQLSNVRTNNRLAPTKIEDGSLDRVRTIFFFVDDTHLSAAGISRARNALNEFVDKQMRQNDQVAIVSSSGQIGFLQQLSDNKTVLRTAISRLSGKRVDEGYTGKTRITEYMASRINNHNDSALFAYLLESTKLEQQMGAGNRHGDHRTASSYSAEPYLRNRLQQVSQQAKFQAKSTLTTLKQLVATTDALPGRKLLFVVSDGFLVEQQDNDIITLLRKVTENAAQTGTVIYSIDLRDTSSISSIDVSTNDAIDFSSRTAGLQISERTANREPLQRMADETGGRVLLNPNSIAEEVSGALDETADYYLLAWRPESGDQRNNKARLNVTLKNHPDWRVRLRRKFYSPSPTEKDGAAEKLVTKNAASDLQATLGSLYPRKRTPVALSVGYVAATQTASSALKISMQIDPHLFAETLETAAKKAALDVIGAAVDDRGIIATFKQVLTITPETLANDGPVIWHQELAVPAGLYQVRVAVRERTTGWSGSDMQWLEVPDLAKANLQMSSLFVAARDNQPLANQTSGPRPIKVNVDRHFKTGSILRFQTYLYGSLATGSELEVRVGVLRNDHLVLTMPPAPVPQITSTNAVGVPYWAEVPLGQLALGKYTLTVTVADLKSRVSSSQQIKFTID